MHVATAGSLRTVVTSQKHQQREAQNPISRRSNRQASEHLTMNTKTAISHIWTIQLPTAWYSLYSIAQCFSMRPELSREF